MAKKSTAKKSTAKKSASKKSPGRQKLSSKKNPNAGTGFFHLVLKGKTVPPEPPTSIVNIRLPSNTQFEKLTIKSKDAKWTSSKPKPIGTIQIEGVSYTFYEVILTYNGKRRIPDAGLSTVSVTVNSQDPVDEPFVLIYP